MAQTFGVWIKETREAGGWTIQLCADRANMKWEAWARLEKDEPRRRNGDAPQRTQGTAKAVAAGLLVPKEEALSRAGYSIDIRANAASEIQAIMNGLGSEDREDLLWIAKMKSKGHESRGKSAGREGDERPSMHTLPSSRVQWDMDEHKIYTHDGKAADDSLAEAFLLDVETYMLAHDFENDSREEQKFERMGY